MIRITTLAALAGLCMGPLCAQAQEKQPQDPWAEQPKARASTQDLIKNLGAESYKVRLDAERQLRALGKDAVPALREAGKSDDAEVQWRSRRLVRQIERGDSGGLQQRDFDNGQPGNRVGTGQQPPRVFRMPQSGFGDPDVQQRFDQLFRDLERDFGVDIPRQHFFHDDFFKDLQQQMDELRKSGGNGAGGNGAGGNGIVKGQSMSMQSGPDGVRVEIKSKNEKGAEESKVYEAPDLDAFRQKYPGVLEQHGLGGGLGLFSWDGSKQPLRSLRLQPFGRGLDTPPDVDQPPRIADQLQPLPPEGKRLGVVVSQQIPEDQRSELGLEAGVGLLVQEVQDDTLARAMGVQAGDVVVRINGKKIGGTADVQEALAAVEPGHEVQVVVNRDGNETTLKANKPAAKGSKLEKRGKKAGKAENGEQVDGKSGTAKDSGGPIR